MDGTRGNSISVFRKMWPERNPLKRIKQIADQWKWAYQRATRGYCDADLWGIDSWFLAVMPQMLVQLAETTHSFPSLGTDDTSDSHQMVEAEASEEIFEAWKGVLLDMAAGFRDADEDTCTMKNPYEDEWQKAYDEFAEQYGFLGEKLEEGKEPRADGCKQVHFPDEFPQWKDVMDRHREAERDIAEFRRDSLDHAMELFRTWFWDLWD